MTQTARGKLDCYLGNNLDPWDIPAGSLLMEEAGAKISAVNGRKWQYGETSILAAHPVLHEKILKLLKK